MESPVRHNGTLLEGQTFEGRFQILSVLGHGGVGVVYKVRHLHMNKVMAIKTLLWEAIPDETTFKRFEQESQTASSLDHPNIIKISDFGKSANGCAYLVMEFLAGPSLEELLHAQSRLDLDQFNSIFGQVCDGMQHAHKKGVIHRDIKPSNIMIVETDERKDAVKIVDFGLAKFTTRESEQHLTQTGAVVGTPLYMSPEQCKGAELDHRSDIYSLACVMYSALTGRVPLKGDSALSTIYKQLVELPPSFAESAPGLNVPVALEQVIFKALHKDPEARQQSMAELHADITNAVLLKQGPKVSPATVPPAAKNAAQLQASLPAGSHLDRDRSLSLAPADTGLHQHPNSAPYSVPAHSAITSAHLRQAKSSHMSPGTAAALTAVSIGAAAAIAFGIWHGLAAPPSQAPSSTSQTPAQQNSPQPSLKTGNDQSQTGNTHEQSPKGSTQAGHAHPVPVTIASTTGARPLAPQPKNPAPDSVPHQSGSKQASDATQPRSKAAQASNALHEAERFEKIGNAKMRAHDYADAQAAYEHCYEFQGSVYNRPHDSRLIFVLARIIESLAEQQSFARAKDYLALVLPLCGPGEIHATELQLDRHNSRLETWRTLGAVCAEIANRSAAQERTGYLGWAGDFYGLAADIDPSPARQILAAKCCAILDLLGQTNEAAAKRREFGLPPPKPATPPQAMKPGNHHKRSIQRHGGMVIRTYR